MLHLGTEFLLLVWLAVATILLARVVAARVNQHIQQRWALKDWQFRQALLETAATRRWMIRRANELRTHDHEGNEIAAVGPILPEYTAPLLVDTIEVQRSELASPQRLASTRPATYRGISGT